MEAPGTQRLSLQVTLALAGTKEQFVKEMCSAPLLARARLPGKRSKCFAAALLPQPCIPLAFNTSLTRPD